VKGLCSGCYPNTGSLAEGHTLTHWPLPQDRQVVQVFTVCIHEILIQLPALPYSGSLGMRLTYRDTKLQACGVMVSLCTGVHWTMEFYAHHSLPHVYLILSVRSAALGPGYQANTACDLTVYSLYLATPLTPGNVSSGYGGYHHGHHHSCHRQRSSHHQQLLGRQRHASATRSVATLQPPNTTHMFLFAVHSPTFA